MMDWPIKFGSGGISRNAVYLYLQRPHLGGCLSGPSDWTHHYGGIRRLFRAYFSWKDRRVFEMQLVWFRLRLLQIHVSIGEKWLFGRRTPVIGFGPLRWYARPQRPFLVKPW